MLDLLLGNCRLPERAAPIDVAIADGRIVRLGGAREPARETVDAKRGFTTADIEGRARRVLDLAVAAGTTTMRAHVEVDPTVRLAGMEAMLALKREYAPALDLQLCAFAQGRRDERNVRRGLAPIRRLLAAGIPVALASNNIRNPFTPIGTADLAHLTFVTAVAAHMGTPELMRELVAAVTTHPARILNMRNYGCVEGARADLVAWECERVEEIVTSLPPRRLVVKAGRVTVEHERRIVERWRVAGSADR